MIIDNLVELNTIQRSELTALPEHTLEAMYFVGINGLKELGTMKNNGTVNKTLAAGATYTIAKGFHLGNGVISAKSLAEQTAATAEAQYLLNPYTAIVNGEVITGSMINNANNSITVGMNDSVVIPIGFYNGKGKVNGPTIALMDGFTITPSDRDQTFQTGNKFLNSNIICKGVTLPPASALKKGYVFKYGDTTIVGEFEGYVAGALDVYNRGSFGTNYNADSIGIHKDTTPSLSAGSTSNYAVTKVIESSDILYTLKPGTDSNTIWGFLICASIDNINTNAYKSFNAIISGGFGVATRSDGFGIQTTLANMYIRIHDANGNMIKRGVAYKTSNDSTNATPEQTVTIDLTDVNTTVQIRIELISHDNIEGRAEYGDTFTARIHKMWFT